MNISDLPILSFDSSTTLHEWFKTNHALSSGIWIRLFKKNSRINSLTYNEILDEALCYGWIDSQAKKYDEFSYLQKFTPRRKKSIWSKRNREHVARLIKSGKMTSAGMQQIEEAKKDGRWNRAYDSPSTMTLPEDFLTALAQHDKAKVFFATLNKTNTYAIAWRLQTAKNPTTRVQRMKKILDMLSKGEKFHP